LHLGMHRRGCGGKREHDCQRHPKSSHWPISLIFQRSVRQCLPAPPTWRTISFRHSGT
jgi:hypothetical protein